MKRLHDESPHSDLSCDTGRLSAAGGLLFYTFAETPVGRLLLAGDGAGLRQVEFCSAQNRIRLDPRWEEDRAPFEDAIRQISDYFEGAGRAFDLKLAPAGTPFQQAVWRELLSIPYGTTISYRELARAVGRPSAIRAVGAANGRNPIAIVIPCHRVIGSNGDLTGYGGGLHIKETLLALERNNR
jgi:methylated-DNA-[protein]-cysteine S-methyltransferase